MKLISVITRSLPRALVVMCAANTEVFENLAIAWMISEGYYMFPSTMYQNPKLEICFTKAIIFPVVENEPADNQLCGNFLRT